MGQGGLLCQGQGLKSEASGNYDPVCIHQSNPVRLTRACLCAQDLLVMHFQERKRQGALQGWLCLDLPASGNAHF